MSSPQSPAKVGSGFFSRQDVMRVCADAPKKTKHMVNMMQFQAVRDIVLNAEFKRRGAFRELNWDRTTNLEALLMQITGDEPLLECSFCEKSAGPFDNCVVSRDNTGSGACAGCHCNSETSRCSHYTGGNKDTPRKRNRNQAQLNDPPANPGQQKRRREPAPAAPAATPAPDGPAEDRIIHIRALFPGLTARQERFLAKKLMNLGGLLYQSAAMRPAAGEKTQP